MKTHTHSKKGVIIALYLIKNGNNNKLERYVFLLCVIVTVVDVDTIGLINVSTNNNEWVGVCYFALSDFMLGCFCSSQWEFLSCWTSIQVLFVVRIFVVLLHHSRATFLCSLIWLWCDNALFWFIRYLIKNNDDLYCLAENSLLAYWRCYCQRYVVLHWMRCCQRHS